MAKSAAKIRNEIRSTKNSIAINEEKRNALNRRIEALDIAINYMTAASSRASTFQDTVKKMDRRPQWVGATKDKFENGGYSPLVGQAKKLKSGAKESLTSLKNERGKLSSQVTALTREINTASKRLPNLKKDLNKAIAREKKK